MLTTFCLSTIAAMQESTAYTKAIVVDECFFKCIGVAR